MAPYRHCPSSAIRVVFSTFGAQSLELCYTVVVFLLIIFSKWYGVYCFPTPLFVPGTPVKYVIYIVVRITPWWSKLPRFVAKHLLLGGKQTE